VVSVLECRIRREQYPALNGFYYIDVYRLH